MEKRPIAEHISQQLLDEFKRGGPIVNPLVRVLSGENMSEPANYEDDAADICELIRKEVIRAKAKHPKDFSSLHEAHSVIREEFEEFWDEVKRQRPVVHAIREELIQTAAMCVRALLEVAK